MAINTGVNISAYGALARLAPGTGVNISAFGALARLAPNLGVNINAYGALARLALSNINPPVWNFTTMPDGYLGNPYSFSWNLSPAAPPVTYSVIAGSLPTGLSLSSGPLDVGTISGTPVPTGPYPVTFNFTLRATNTYGSADQAFSITIHLPTVGALGNFGFVN